MLASTAKDAENGVAFREKEFWRAPLQGARCSESGTSREQWRFFTEELYKSESALPRNLVTRF